MKSSTASQMGDRRLWWLGLVFGGVVILGLVWPDRWWGSHFLAFWGTPGAGICLVGGALLWGWGVWRSPGLLAPEVAPLPGKLLLALAATLVAVLCYHFPMFADAYGDAAWFGRSFARNEDHSMMEPLEHLRILLDPNVFNPKSGERTVLNAVALLKDGLDLGTWEAFRLLGALCAGAWVFLWGAFVKGLGTDRMRVPLLWVLGLGTPIALLFMGHLEIYAPGLVTFLGFGVVLVRFFREGRRSLLGWATLWWLLALKMHSLAWLLAPALVLAWGNAWLSGQVWWNRLFTVRGFALCIVLPVVAAGLVLYFGVLGDHRDPRFLGDGVKVTERLFLPLFSPEAPLDRYNLLSGNHLLDLLQVFWLWSPGAWLVLAWAGLRGAVGREVLVVALSLLLMAGLLFMVNPLLGMTIDWDLFALPAPLLLLLAGLRLTGSARHPKPLLGPMLALVLWVTVPAIGIHQAPDSLGLRLESLGKHSFRTYWIRSSGTILSGLDMRRDGSAEFQAETDALVAELEPLAISGDDHEFAYLLWETGRYYRQDLGDLARAFPYHQKASLYSPRMPENVLGLMECHFVAGRFGEALGQAQILVELEHPDARQARRIALHCALEAGAYSEAAQLAKEFVGRWPDDQLVQRIHLAFEQGEDPTQLKYLFQRR